MKNIKWDNEKFYAYIGVSNKVDYEPYSLLIDSNAAVYLETFYYNPYKLIDKNQSIYNERIKIWKATMNLLINSITKDPVYGFAIQESCWNYEKIKLDEGKQNIMEKALEEQNLWDKGSIIKNGYSVGRKKIYITEKFQSKSDYITMVDNYNQNPLMLGSYASVLMINILQKSKYDAVTKFKKFCEFQNEKLYLRHAIEENIAAHCFLGNKNLKEAINGIFKFDKKPVLINAWNTSWDIFYLRCLYYSFFDSFFKHNMKVHNPKLITGDKDLIALATIMSVDIMIDTGEGMAVAITTDYSNIKSKYQRHYEQINADDINNIVSRQDRLNQSGNYVEHLIKVIKELENDIMGVN